MPIQLIVVEGPEMGQTFTLAGHENFVIGRSEAAHFHPSKEDRHCSRLHFLVEVNPPLCQVLDLESNNGTHVNGTRITGRTLLKDGDHIKAGRTLLQVRILPEMAEAVAVAAVTVEGASTVSLAVPVVNVEVVPVAG